MNNIYKKLTIFAISVTVAFVALLFATNAYAIRDDSVFGIYSGSYIAPSNPLGYDLLLSGSSRYLNFNNSVGSTGYGFRDSAGTMQFKNSGGSWSAFAPGGGGSGGALTLSDIGTNSNTTALSLYQMTSAQNVEFRTADATALFRLNETAKTISTGGPILSPSGTVGAPSYAFGSETNMGIYRPTTAMLGFSVGSTARANLTATGLGVGLGTTASSAIIHANAPALMSTVADTDGALRLGASSVTSTYLTAGISTAGYGLIQGGRTSDSTAQTILLQPFGGNVVLGADGNGSAKLQIRSNTSPQLIVDYGTGLGMSLGVNASGNTTLDLFSSVVAFPELTINDRVRGSGGLFVRNSFYAVGGQGVNDTSMTGFFDRDALINSDLTGSVTVNITGAGTNTPANNYLIVNGEADFSALVTGVDATTSQVEIIVDTGAQQLNYSAAVWQPYLMTRGVTQGTYANSINVHISSDGVNWFQGTGWSTSDFQTDAQVKDGTNTRGTLWLGSNSTVAGLTGAQWRYARFVLTNFVIDSGYAFNGNLWISQIGIRHYSAPMTKQYLNVRGANTTYGGFTIAGSGNLLVGDIGTNLTILSTNPRIQGVTTSGIAISSVGVADGTNNRRLGMYVNQTAGEQGLAWSRSTGAVPFFFKDVATNVMTIDASGDVGMGTGTQTNVPRKLTINSDTDASLYIRRNTVTTGDYAEVLFQTSTSDLYATGIRSQRVASGFSDMLFLGQQTAGSAYGTLYEMARFTAPGNLGLGTGATVSAKLHSLATTEQLRLGYDVSNYVPFTVSSIGDLAIAPTGGDLGLTGTFTLTGNINQAGTSAQLDINPYQTIRLGRSTNNASFAVEVYKGDNSTTINHRLRGNGASYLSIDNGSLGIGTASPDTSAKVDITSTTQGFLPPRMTATQASAITPVNGLMLYVTDTNGTFTAVGFWGYEAGAWVKL